MTFQSKKRSQAKIDVITPRATRAHLRPFNQAELLDAAMIVFNRPREASPFDSLQVAHLNFIGRPQFNVAVCGDYLEHSNQAITFEPDDATLCWDLHFADGTQALAVGIDFAIRLQPREPSPAERANQFQVFKARIPTIKDHARRQKAPLMGRFDHRLEVVVLGQRVLLLVKDAVVTWNMTVAVSPQQSDKVDAAHHLVMLTRPMARDQFDLAS